MRGVGVNILEDARHWIGLLQYNLSTPLPLDPYYHTFPHLTPPHISAPLSSIPWSRNRTKGRILAICQEDTHAWAKCPVNWGVATGQDGMGGRDVDKQKKIKRYRNVREAEKRRVGRIQ
jgi:hypothetical protein